MKIRVNDTQPWYHGSNRRLEVLREGSTVTQWRDLAEAFSHKPAVLCIDDEGTILHTGSEQGYLYAVNEPVRVGVDVYPHPRTTMDANAEFLTNRPLRLSLLCEIEPPSPALVADMQREIARICEEHGRERSVDR